MVARPYLMSPDQRWMATAPFRDSLDLGAYDTAPGTARGHARNLLREWNLGHLWDVAELIISELITNSVRAVEMAEWPLGRPPVRLWLHGDPQRVCVLAWDAVAVLPVARAAGAEEESGRGLMIVDALCAQWGCYDPSEPLGGKVTWALIGTAWRDQLSG
jgi:anti-sigma regulatory factor (Ser/Thr protein kinase)